MRTRARNTLVPAPSDLQLLPSGIAFPSPSKLILPLHLSSVSWIHTFSQSSRLIPTPSPDLSAQFFFSFFSLSWNQLLIYFIWLIFISPLPSTMCMELFWHNISGQSSSSSHVIKLTYSDPPPPPPPPPIARLHKCFWWDHYLLLQSNTWNWIYRACILLPKREILFVFSFIVYYYSIFNQIVFSFLLYIFFQSGIETPDRNGQSLNGTSIS